MAEGGAVEIGGRTFRVGAAYGPRNPRSKERSRVFPGRDPDRRGAVVHRGGQRHGGGPLELWSIGAAAWVAWAGDELPPGGGEGEG